MNDGKKIAAAVSGVINYLEAQERMRRSQQLSASTNRWGISGRQMQMLVRSRMQVKEFYGWKLRFIRKAP